MDKGNTPQLERKIGTGALAINVINLTVGSGIFILPAYVAGYLGSMSFLAYLICSWLIGLIMLCFAEMGSDPESTGGAYSIIEKAFGPLVGFLANTLFWFGYSVLSIAAILNAMSDMLAIWFPVFSEYWFRVIFIFLLIAIIAFVNIRGVKSGSRMVIIMTTLKLAPLLLVVFIGIFNVKAENLVLMEFPEFQTLGSACLLLFFAFAGSETSLNISGEIKNPEKTIPKGIFWGITGILTIYLALQFVATGILGTELALFKEAPLAETAIRLVGPIGGTVLIATGIISMYALVAGDILATSRLPFRASENGLLPKGLSKVHPKFKSPHIAIIFYGSMIFLMAISGGFSQLAILSSSSVLVIYLGVVLAMLKSRIKPNPKKTLSFRAPGGLLIPVLALLVLIWLISYAALTDFIAMGIFFIIVAVYYFSYKWWNTKR